jgi:hypothetical protein
MGQIICVHRTQRLLQSGACGTRLGKFRFAGSDGLGAAPVALLQRLDLGGQRLCGSAYFLLPDCGSLLLARADRGEFLERGALSRMLRLEVRDGRVAFGKPRVVCR